MPAIEYDFYDRLSASNDDPVLVRDLILENISGALNAFPAHLVNDRRGVDWWVEQEGGQHLAVDVKIRTIDYKQRGKDDLALETWSVVERKKIGWTRDSSKRSDYILWLWVDSGRWCLVPFPMLCGVFQTEWESWRERYQTNQQFTPGGEGYHSECVFVPRGDVWAAIYHKYGGAAA